MGEVIADSMKLCGRHAVVLFILVVLLSWLPGLAYRQLYPLAIQSAAKLQLGFRPGGVDEWGSAAWAYRVLATLVVFVCTTAMEVGAAAVALADRRGFRASIGEALKVIGPALPQILPIAVIGNAGSLLFILAPGLSHGLGLGRVFVGSAADIAVFVVFGPLAAVVAAERLGLLKTLSRSIALTNRHRWSLFGLYLIVFLVEFL